MTHAPAAELIARSNRLPVSCRCARHNARVELVEPSLSVKEHNRMRVVAAFSGVASLSRAEIAQRTGLSRTTVSSLVDELLHADTLCVAQSRQDVGPGRADSGAPGQRGRPPELLALVHDVGYGIALDFGHETLQVAIADLGGRLLRVGSLAVGEDATAAKIAARARVVTDALVKDAGLANQPCRGVVASIPEPIGRDGLIARDNVESRWHGENPGALIGEALGRPVHAENDANLAVLGESTFGISRNVADVLYVKISHGVGCGIVLNGRLVRGSDGLAGEIGHMQVKPDGVICTCGSRGCLYTVSTSRFLAQSLHAATGNQDLGLKDLENLAVRGHAGAGRVLRDAGWEVGRVLANLCNTLNPRHIVVGGRLAHAGEWAILGLRESIGYYTEARAAQALDILPSTLDERAELWGAIAMAIGIIDPVSGAPRAGNAPAPVAAP